MTEAKPCCHGHESKPPQPVSPEDLTKVFTCPMHPEVRQIGPGSCPSCGMALEPADPFAESSGPDPELQSLKLRMFWSLLLTGPLIVLAMGEMHHFTAGLTPWQAHLAQFLLATPVVLLAGASFHKLAWQSVKNASPNMFTLISIGTIAAWGYSVVAFFAPDLFPDALRNDHGLVGIYFEASAVIIALVIVGQILENIARRKTGDAMRELVKLKPDTAILFIDNDLDTEIHVDKIEVGNVLRVRPGTLIPVDGYIEFGSSFVDESMLTGESAPVAKGVGSKVMAGTMNKNGSFLMRAVKVKGDTLLSQIVRMVGEAQRSKAPIQKLADQVAEWFVPLVVVAAVAAGFAWFTWGPEPRLAYSLVAAVSVLIIACPCALGLATPMSVTVALGRAARNGVLIRNAETLERISKVTALVFDKTGTLTEGKPRVVSLLPIGNHSEDSILTYAASVEAHSEHPLASAVRAEARLRNLPLRECFAFESFTGGGVKGTVELEPVILGNARFLREMGVDVASVESTVAELENGGESLVLVAVEGSLAGIIGVRDPIKQGVKEAITHLQAAGLHLILSTGDSRKVAENVAKELGIAHVQAEVLPKGKKELVESLQKEGFVVAMAGDGINDSPALAIADVGIAMGTGTDVAIATAGVTLVRGDIRAISFTLGLGRATIRNIKQNLAFAFGYNFLGVPIAAGVLWPFFGVLLSPMVASVAMSFSSVSVIANALRLKNTKI